MTLKSVRIIEISSGCTKNDDIYIGNKNIDLQGLQCICNVCSKNMNITGCTKNMVMFLQGVLLNRKLFLQVVLHDMVIFVLGLLQNICTDCNTEHEY